MNDRETQRCCIHPEMVQAARQRIPQSHLLEHAAELLKAVSEPTRIKLLSALGVGELCVGDLAEAIEQTESATSHQLRLLRTLRLVTARKDGRITYYRLNDDHVTQLIQAALEHASEKDT
ncbi:MAG: metalloregulator ArsR/SmtB family transcription factor [Deinococcaceae bacterium]